VTTGRRARSSVIALLAAAAVGCSASAPARFYSLDSTATLDGPPLTQVSVMVGPVTVPAAVDQPQFVVQVAPNRVEVDEFNRWVAPLNDSIARAVAGDLASQLGTPDVAPAPLVSFDPTYSVAIDVLRFESIRGQAAVVEAVWAVHRTAGGAARTGHTLAREAVQGNGFDALAAAHSRALAIVSADITTAIRTDASNNRKVAKRRDE
jgi:uncharacterized lipoprotein YmbA